MLNGSGLTTSFAALASVQTGHVFFGHGALAVSGKNPGSILPVVVAIVLLVMLVVMVGGIVVVRRKRAEAWEGPAGQGALAFPDARSGYGQQYGDMVAAQQESWPWARQIAPPVGYNPTTPIPDTLMVPGKPSYAAVSIQHVPAMPLMPPIPTALASEMARVPAISMMPVAEASGTLTPPVTPLPEVPVAPAVSIENPLQALPAPKPDAELEVIMRQVQVGLFALPVQHRSSVKKERTSDLLKER